LRLREASIVSEWSNIHLLPLIGRRFARAPQAALSRIGSQNRGSAATQSFAGKLNEGRATTTVEPGIGRKTIGLL
jgi:hypothetical protein